MVAAMDKGRVDARSSFAFLDYQYDGRYAVEVQKAHPGRFALASRSTRRSGVADVIADWKKTPGTVAFASIDQGDEPRAGRPGLDRILRAAVRHDFPVNILFWATSTRHGAD